VKRNTNTLKVFFVIVFITTYQLSTAQTSKIVSGNDPVRQAGGVNVSTLLKGITDKNIYDMEGNILDSAAAAKLLRTYEYQSAWAIPKGQTSLKRVVQKVDPVKQAEMDRYVKMVNRPKSNKLWEGVTLDLSPLEKRTDLEKLQGKAVVLIFWSAQPAHDLYGRVNEVIADNMGSNKFEVFAITHNPYNVAKEGLKKNPILNAKLVLDAPGIVDYYETGNKPVIVVTNAQHQITYAITSYATMTPRILNKLLKEL
jgi:hypothetical protein